MNGLHELPLIIFTVLAQTVVGAWLIFTFVLCRENNSESRSFLHKTMFVLLALLGIGFISSVMHLGSPMRAFNSLNQIGSSMMSNEIACGALFFALAGFYWLFSSKLPQGLGKLWLAISSLAGLAFMYMMNQLYHISSVPTWNSSLTSWQFYLTVIIGGSALAHAFLASNPHKSYQIRCTPTLYVLGVILAAIVAIYQGFGLNQIHSSVRQAVELVPDFAILQALRFCLLALGGVLLLKGKNLASLRLAAIIVIFAEMIGRTLFYALHMTVGMA